MVMPMITPEAGAAFMTDWLERQKEMFEALVPKTKKSAPATVAPKVATPKPEEAWRSYMDFWTTFAKAMPAHAGALDGGAIETLVDPAAGARNSLGPPEPKTALTKGPSFATLWDWDQKSLKAYGAWLGLQQAIAAQRTIVDAAWADASRLFQEAITRPVDEEYPAITTWRGGLDFWLSTANKRLLEMQRSDEFLQAQQGLLAASMDYRLKLREIAEELCELYQVPGRSEVDELARMVHELRRDMREIKRKDKRAGRSRKTG